MDVKPDCVVVEMNFVFTQTSVAQITIKTLHNLHPTQMFRKLLTA